MQGHTQPSICEDECKYINVKPSDVCRHMLMHAQPSDTWRHMKIHSWPLIHWAKSSHWGTQAPLNTGQHTQIKPSLGHVLMHTDTPSSWYVPTRANPCPALDACLHIHKHALPSMHEDTHHAFDTCNYMQIHAKAPETHQHMPIHAQLLICGNIWRCQLCTWYLQTHAPTRKSFYADHWM